MTFLYSSVYSCYLSLICSASVRSLLFLSFIMPILVWFVPLISPIFLKRSLAFPFFYFSSASLHCSLKKNFLSLLAASLWNSASSWVYLSLSPLIFAFLFPSALCKASSNNHFCFLHFFFFGMVLVTTSYAVLQTSIHSSSGTRSTRSNPLNLFSTSTV